MARPKKKNRKNRVPSAGWLTLIESEPPQYHCQVIGTDLTGACNQHGCSMWSPNRKIYSCVGAFASMKSSSCEERLQATSTNNRDKRVSLRESADGKLSFNDISHLYDISRQRVEGFVSEGADIVSALAPLLADIDSIGVNRSEEPTKRIGNPTLFTHSSPIAHIDPETKEVTRVCVCCESIIEPDDQEMVIAVLDREEVAWCSRECAHDLTIDGYLVSNRYKRHWASIALAVDKIDERSRVREVNQERMEALANEAIAQGYQ